MASGSTALGTLGASNRRIQSVRLGDVPALLMVMSMLWRRPKKPSRPRVLETAQPAQPVHCEPSPSISIVVPVFNDRQAAERTIRSILAQQYPSLQILAVDQGSDAGTRQMLGELEPAIVVLSSPEEGGEAAAVAMGFEAATGQYLVQLMPGETLMPGALDGIRRAVKRKAYRVMWFREMESDPQASDAPRPARVQRGASLYTLFQGVEPHSCAIAIRRSVYRKVGGIRPELRCAGLQDLLLRLACRTRFWRIQGCLGCRVAGERTLGEREARVRARELERSASEIRLRMRWTTRVMCELRHLATRIDDASLWRRVS